MADNKDNKAKPVRLPAELIESFRALAVECGVNVDDVLAKGRAGIMPQILAAALYTSMKARKTFRLELALQMKVNGKGSQPAVGPAARPAKRAGRREVTK